VNFFVTRLYFPVSCGVHDLLENVKFCMKYTPLPFLHTRQPSLLEEYATVAVEFLGEIPIIIPY